ncbi:outer membrane lipoprotein-sorting protein [Bacteroidota bacterium]
MKLKISIHILLFIAVGIIFNESVGQELTATEIVQKADEKFQGEITSKGEMKISIIRPAWERTLSVKIWSKGSEYSLTLITAPANEKGQTFLKRENELWNWNPKIQRMIKLPPSMMSQGWMGSDYSNDDILRESSLIKDFNHQLIGEELVEGYECYVIEMIPKEDAVVVWGKIILWISKEDFYQLKAEFYDEDDYLIRTFYSFDIQNFDDRKLPSRTEIVPAEEPGNKTVVEFVELQFNKPIPDSFFSQQNMKNVR